METYNATPLLWTVTPDSGSWCWDKLRYLSQLLCSLQVINEGVFKRKKKSCFDHPTS